MASESYGKVNIISRDVMASINFGVEIMARNIVIEHLSTKHIEKQDIEIVERKGIGHPDSIADGLAESVSRSLCKM